jgi:hypothetical protein
MRGEQESADVARAAQPPVGKTLVSQTWKQGVAVSYALPAGTFIDPQHLALTYSAALADGSALPSWLKFNAKTGGFTGMPPAGGDFTVTVTATDSAGLSVAESFDVHMVDAPVAAAGAIASQVWLQGQTVDIVLPAGAFVDPQGQSLKYSAKLSSGAALPPWLHVNAVTGELTGTPSSTVANMTIVERATDSSGLSAAISFGVTGVRAPLLSHHEADQIVQPGKIVHLWLAGEFSDPQHQALTYRASAAGGAPLPSWLSFDATTHVLSGVVPATGGTTSVVITATNASGLSATDSFKLSALFAPVLQHQTPDQTFLAGAADSFTLPAGTFTDPNGQHLTYTATQTNGLPLPSWLHFNAQTQTFSGMPKVGNLSLAAIEALTPQQWMVYGIPSVPIEVTAHDSSGLTAQESFMLHVTNLPLVGV